MYYYSLTNKEVIERIAKYNAEVPLYGIYHDAEMNHPIETIKALRDKMTAAQLAESTEIARISLKDLPKYIEALREKYHFNADKQFIIYGPAEKSLYSILPGLISTPGFKPEKLKGRSREFVYNYNKAASSNNHASVNPGSRLERNDALALLSSVDCLGAIELKELQAIVFFSTKGTFSFITYGLLCSSGAFDAVLFNLDNGFFFAGKPVKESSNHPILLEMQNYFERWKANNYEGDLFPSTLAICETPAAASATLIKKIQFDVPSVEYRPLFDLFKKDPRIMMYQAHSITRPNAIMTLEVRAEDAEAFMIDLSSYRRIASIANLRITAAASKREEPSILPSDAHDDQESPRKGDYYQAGFFYTYEKADAAGPASAGPHKP